MQNFIINESAVDSSVSIKEKNPNTVEFIAVLQEADRPNRNGRIYSKQVLEHALASPYIQERLATKSLLSECGHPMDTSVERQMTIDMHNAACIIKEFWWEGNLLKAKCETCDTSVGRDMKGLIEQGMKVAFSLRAQGNVHKDPMTGYTVVEDPIQICTYDWVLNPSHDKAFLQSVCEQTFRSFLDNKRVGKGSMALCESTRLYEEGEMIPTNAKSLVETVDYSKSFYKKNKPLTEMYIYDPKDKVQTITENAVYLENGNTIKKVMLEDYITKDIRNKVAHIMDEEDEPAAEAQKAEEVKLGDAAAQPVATADIAPTEAPVEPVTQADVLPADENKQSQEIATSGVDMEKEAA